MRVSRDDSNAVVRSWTYTWLSADRGKVGVHQAVARRYLRLPTDGNPRRRNIQMGETMTLLFAGTALTTAELAATLEE